MNSAVDRSTPQAHSDAASTAGSAQPACALNAEYLALIDKAQRNMFDPAKLGNLQAVKSAHACEIKSTDDAIAKANVALRATGDPYDKILTAAQYKALDDDAHGHFGGVGIHFEIDSAKLGKSPLVVHDLIPNSPASEDLKPGDVITAIDGQDITHLKQQDALKLMQGDVGTPIALTVVRGDHIVYTDLIRQEITVPSVQSRQLSDGIAYLNVDNFEDETSAAQLQQQMQKYKNAPAYVIDLRDNPGGRVDSALLAASLFVKSGTLVNEKVRIESSSPPKYYDVREELTGFGDLQVKKAPGLSLPRLNIHGRLSDVSQDKPVVILVNDNTASAAEMFTAAVRENNPHATVVGEKTFGKGIGQIVMPNMPGNSVMSVTNMHYLTPHGEWLGDGANNRNGIQPDRTLAPLPPDGHVGSADDKQLQAAVEILEQKLASGSK
ncbi:MAG TPA: S41 family peptidase [Trichormus sp.]